MKEVHEFERPRNLYEKLVRDNQRLEEEISGDNLFTFISTILKQFCSDVIHHSPHTIVYAFL